MLGMPAPLCNGITIGPIENSDAQTNLFANFSIAGDLVDITNNFNANRGTKGIFENTGMIVGRDVYTFKSLPKYKGPRTMLGDILVDDSDVGDEYFLRGPDLKKWKYLKGAKKDPRKKSNGEIFYYCEGPMSFPDPLDRPARTIITSEGGTTPSRFKHVVEQQGKLRRLTPIELERANMFPDNHTKLDGVSENMRAFLMGNALVVGIVTKLGKEIYKRHNRI